MNLFSIFLAVSIPNNSDNRHRKEKEGSSFTEYDGTYFVVKDKNKNRNAMYILSQLCNTTNDK